MISESVDVKCIRRMRRPVGIKADISMVKQFYTEKDAVEKGNRLYPLLRLLCAPQRGEHVAHIRLCKVYRKTLGRRFELPSDEKLEAAYVELVAREKASSADKFLSTPAQDDFVARVQQQTKRVILPNVLLGNQTLDCFFPTCGERNAESPSWKDIKRGLKKGSGVYSGLGVEIDGGSHNREVKGRMDSLKLSVCKTLGILAFGVDNNKVGSKNTADIIKFVKDKPPQNSRATRSMWRRIWLFTIAVHRDPEMLEILFGLSADALHSLSSAALKDKRWRKRFYVETTIS